MRKVALAHCREARCLECLAHFSSRRTVDVSGIARVGLGVDPSSKSVVDDGKMDQGDRAWRAELTDGIDAGPRIGEVLDQVDCKNYIESSVERGTIE